MRVVPVRSTLTRDSESVLKCLLLTNWALRDVCSTLSPVGLALKNSVPMLWELHKDTVPEIRRIITYDAGFQGHRIVREFVENLNSKSITLEKGMSSPIELWS
jgi:hypothetical protein